MFTEERKVKLILRRGKRTTYILIGFITIMYIFVGLSQLWHKAKVKEHYKRN